MVNAAKKNLTISSLAGNEGVARITVKKRTSAAAMTEIVFACKWSARILNLIRHGVQRPGAITRTLEGLTTKVLNECLRRLMFFGLVKRTSHPEIPPRVEYSLTDLGERFITVLDTVEELQAAIDKDGLGINEK